MPDWKELVRQRMLALNLPHDAKEEVISELAAHLEEIFEAARIKGLNEAEAFQRALQEVTDWHVLAADIRDLKFEEEFVNDRTKNLWLPGMVTLLGASLLLMLLQFVGFRPHLVWMGNTAMLFYWPWLALLPVFGALGARLSQRARGTIWARLSAVLSPALVMLAAMAASLPFGLAIDGVSFFRLVLFGIGVTNWVVLPALALLLGALPFLRESPGLTTRST